MIDLDSLAPGEGAAALERGDIILVKDRPFAMSAQEVEILSSNLSADGVKNVSLGPEGALGGTPATGETAAHLHALMSRYACWARTLVEEAVPSYGPHLRPGRTSWRPRAIDEGPVSARKDDRRLHVDAFASQPTRGERILRVFSNVNRHGEPRTWRVGEPFEDYARRWIGRARRPIPLEARALRALRITKSQRADYDFLMLALHDRAKLDTHYQATAPRQEAIFPAGSSWIVFTDRVVHAAIGGRQMLEQTFYLPVAAMAEPEQSPLRILERLEGRTLT
jgi:hypothetical protein